MMKKLFLLVPVFSMIFGCGTTPEDRGIWSVQLPEARQGLTYSNSTQWNDEALNWNTGEAGKSIYFKIPQGKLTEYEYLICEVYHNEKYSVRIGFNFFDEKSGGEAIVWQSGDNTSNSDLQPRIGVKIGALPDLKTNIVFPLSHLDGQEIFLHRFPRQLKGTVSGRRIAKDQITAFSISVDPYETPRFEPQVQIKRIYFASDPPEPFEKPAESVVDEFGQWAKRDFPGRIESEDELKSQLATLESLAQQAQFPDGWSQYGGWKKKQFEPKGFFDIKKDEDMWWLADPDGYAFLSVGVDCMRPNSSGWIEGHQDIFSWLPDRNDPQFDGCYSDRRGEAMFDFFTSNMMRVYGEQWEQKWQKITVGLMKEYGINTIGNWSDDNFIKNAEMPYVYPLSDFPSTSTNLYRDFPDVFSQEYADKAIEFAAQLKSLKDDPYMIGYFLRNEPHWAFGKNNIAFEMFAESMPSDSKNEFVSWIAENYGDIKEFNERWEIDLASFEALSEQTFVQMPSEQAASDFWDFSKILVRKYVDVVCDEVEKIDNNHLNLGMRYAWISSDLLYEAGERFDVFSINGYAVPFPPETASIYEKSGKPVMIGEFHFGSIDRGLPSTGITGVASQTDRGKAYRNYVEHGLSRNELIGLHYFQWLDQPIFGRFDGENYNIGVLSITNTPYKEKIEAMKKTNLNIYEIITEEIPIYDGSVDIIPSIYF